MTISCGTNCKCSLLPRDQCIDRYPYVYHWSGPDKGKTCKKALFHGKSWVVFSDGTGGWRPVGALRRRKA